MKFAIILSGCGVFDGSEIHEATLAMLAIAKNGGSYELFAPDVKQHHVMNHLTGEEMEEQRAGRYVTQSTGYKAFIPEPLPPAPPVVRDEELDTLLSKADRALGRLDGVTSILPNTDFFVAMYVRYEAVLSSQIEGTQSTLEDVLQFEADEHGQVRKKDVKEVVNYVMAMNHGLDRLKEFPLSLRLIKEIHEKLLKNVRGANREPGEFRRGNVVVRIRTVISPIL